MITFFKRLFRKVKPKPYLKKGDFVIVSGKQAYSRFFRGQKYSYMGIVEEYDEVERLVLIKREDSVRWEELRNVTKITSEEAAFYIFMEK